MTKLVQSEYDSFEKKTTIRLSNNILSSILFENLGIQYIEVNFIATKIEGGESGVCLAIVYQSQESKQAHELMIDELFIKLNDEIFLHYEKLINQSTSVGCIISTDDLAKICTSSKVEMRIKNGSGHADFMVEDMQSWAKVMYNVAVDDTAYSNEVAEKEKEEDGRLNELERKRQEREQQLIQTENRLKNNKINKYFEVDYDKFKQKYTVNQKEELELEVSDDSQPLQNVFFKFRYVYIKEELIRLLIDLKIFSLEEFHLKNGEIIILIDDSKRLRLPANENYSNLYAETVHVESAFYKISEEELKALCEANMLAIRITNGEEHVDITTNEIQITARRFYNAVIDETAYTDDLQTQEERKAAERERLRQERLAKEAEEERIRAEKRAEWWAANKKKVIVTTLTIIALVIGVIVYHRIAENKRYQQALAEANAYIASGDSCVAIYHFDEARAFYELAKQTGAWKYGVYEKESALRDAQNKADKEYNEALRRLKIFLDADDGEFNDLSNACLEKMIQIYPDRKETKYFQKLRKK